MNTKFKRAHNFFKITILLSGLVFLFSGFNTAVGAEDSEELFNPGEMITHHIADAHVWHLWDGAYGTIPLPVIIYSDDRGIEIFSSGNFYDLGRREVAYLFVPALSGLR